MNRYKLPHGFKRSVIKDAVYSVHREGKSIRDWAEDYFFYQEIIFPGEKEYVERIVFVLKEDECRFDPYSNPSLIESLVEKIEGE